MILNTSQWEIQENCSAGCPCSDFECIETTTAPDVTTATVPATKTPSNSNAVLVLSTYESSNKPIIVDFDGNSIYFDYKFNLFLIIIFSNYFQGNINEDFGFEYGIGTQAHQGCGVTFQNEYWYFGGNSPNKRQVSYLLRWLKNDEW